MVRRNYRKMYVLAVLLLMGAGPAPGPSTAGVDPAEKKVLGAEGLLARGQYEMARQEFEEFLKQFGTDVRATRARYGRALCAYHLKDEAGAVGGLEGVVGDKGFAHRDEALALLGHVHLTGGRAEKALGALEALLKEYPKSPQAENAAVNRAQALYRLARFEESAAGVRELLKGAPQTPLRGSALYVLALDQRELGQDDAAVGTLREIAGAYPNAPFAPDAQLLIGETLSGQGKHEEAIAQCRKVAGEAPEGMKPAATFGLGMALSRAGKYAEAEGCFGEILARYKESPYAGPARLQQAVAELQAGRRDKAREMLAAVGREIPGLAGSAAYWAARCDLLEAKFDAARGALERLAQGKPAELQEIEFDLTYCDLMTGREGAAVRGLEAFRGRYPRSGHKGESLYYEALAFYRLGEPEKGIAFCDQVVKLGTAGMGRSATLLKGECLLAMGSFEKADEIFAALEKDSTKAEERLRLGLRRGQCAFFSKDYATAEARLAAVAKEPQAAKDPVLQEAAFLLGDAQLQQGKNEAALGTLRGYVAGGQARRDEAMFKLALAQLRVKDAKGAEETLGELRKGDAKSPWVARAWLETAQLAYQGGRPAEAGQALATLLAAKPAEDVAAPAVYLTARMAMDQKKFAEAAERLEELGRNYPKNALAEDAAFGRGVCLKEARRPEAALGQLEAYLREYPGGKHAAAARQQAAVCRTALGKPAEAVAILKEMAGRPETRNDGVLYDLAWAQRAAKDSAGAIVTYQGLLKEFPAGQRAAAARVELPELLYAAGRYAEAVELLKTALASPGTAPQLRSVGLYRLGHCYLRLGQPLLAAETFDAFVIAFSRDPLAGDALSEAGAAYAQADKLDVAKRRQGKVIAEYPGTEAASLATVRLGEALNQGGDYNAAAETFTHWVSEHPKHALAARARFGLGWSLENRGQYAQAREQYAQVIAADNGTLGARAQFQVGETYFGQKQYDQAARELLKVDILYSAPEWAARALYEAGRAFEQLKDVDQARQQFRECIKKYKDSDVAAMARKRLEALGG